MTLAVLIPAFQPDATLARTAAELAEAPQVRDIIIVNDGSARHCDEVFRAAAEIRGVTVLTHEQNRGKGAALRTGMEHFLSSSPPESVLVTADADGQHLTPDIIEVGVQGHRTPDALVLGSRLFGPEVPLRSRFGNLMTRHVLRLTMGCSIGDTQTGLRAIPRALIPSLLGVPSPRYEFELEMLLVALQRGVPIREVPIQTVYEPGNPTSHFDPLLDSARIYRALLRHKLGGQTRRAGAARV